MVDPKDNPFNNPFLDKEEQILQGIVYTETRHNEEREALYEKQRQPMQQLSGSKSTIVIGPLTYEAFQQYGGLSAEQRAALDGLAISPPPPAPDKGYVAPPGLRNDDHKRLLLEVDAASGKVTRAYPGAVIVSLHENDVLDKTPPIVMQKKDVRPAEFIADETIDLRNINPDKPPKTEKLKLPVNIELDPKQFAPTPGSIKQFELNKPEPVLPKIINGVSQVASNVDHNNIEVPSSLPGGKGGRFMG